MVYLEHFILKRENSKSIRKLYACTCDSCGIDRGYKRLSKSGSYCRCCFGKIKHTGKVFSEETKQKMRNSSWMKNNPSLNPWYGRSHSEETKILLSQKQKDFCALNGNQFLTGKSKGKHTQESINKISVSNTGKEPKWKGRIFQYDGPKGKFKMRSSYELFYANWLDQQDIEWKYEPHFKLNNGKMYSPDFQLDNNVIIEVKGYWSEVGRSKWEHFCKDYPEITKLTLMKDDLVEIGLEV